MKEIGRKGKNQSSGFIFFPYIKVLEFSLPLKLLRIDKDLGPIFKKISDRNFR
jgi:hypothetical protein